MLIHIQRLDGKLSSDSPSLGIDYNLGFIIADIDEGGNKKKKGQNFKTLTAVLGAMHRAPLK
jgi:hypothetical protein